MIRLSNPLPNDPFTCYEEDSPISLAHPFGSCSAVYVTPFVCQWWRVSHRFEVHWFGGSI